MLRKFIRFIISLINLLFVLVSFLYATGAIIPIYAFSVVGFKLPSPPIEQFFGILIILFCFILLGVSFFVFREKNGRTVISMVGISLVIYILFGILETYDGSSTFIQFLDTEATLFPLGYIIVIAILSSLQKLLKKTLTK